MSDWFEEIKKKGWTLWDVNDYNRLIAEVERLRSFGKDDNCLDCGRRAHLKENDIMLCSSCHTRRIKNGEQIASLQSEVEKLKYDNDNFAHENHSLTGDVAAVVERRAVAEKEIESLKSQLVAVEEELAAGRVVMDNQQTAIDVRNAKLEAAEKERDDFEWHYKDRVRAVALKLIEKEELEAENAKLQERVEELEFVKLGRPKDTIGYWCPTCQKSVNGQEVTFDETHDSREGGCGGDVI